jgi:serine/threonine protein kinase
MARSLDVFSLGCIAYYLFSGQPPAESVLELAREAARRPGPAPVRRDGRLRRRQQELVQFATCPDVLARYDTVQEFLETSTRSRTNSPRPTPKPRSTPARPTAVTASRAASPSSSAWAAARPATRCWCARTAATKSWCSRSRWTPRTTTTCRPRRGAGQAAPPEHRGARDTLRGRAHRAAAQERRRRQPWPSASRKKVACRWTCCSASAKS